MREAIGFSARHQAAFLLGQALGLLMVAEEELRRADERLAADKVDHLAGQLHTVARNVFGDQEGK